MLLLFICSVLLQAEILAITKIQIYSNKKKSNIKRTFFEDGNDLVTKFTFMIMVKGWNAACVNTFSLSEYN